MLLLSLRNLVRSSLSGRVATLLGSSFVGLAQLQQELLLPYEFSVGQLDAMKERNVPRKLTT